MDTRTSITEDKSSGTPSPSSPSIISSGSKSSRSDASTIRKKEEDFTKDNVTSPLDLECSIQSERINKIIDEVIYKVKLAISLPSLIQGRRLSAVLDSQHYDELAFIYEEYGTNMHLPSFIDMATSAINDVKAGDLSMKNRLSPELAYLVYILNSFPALRPLVEEMVDEMKENYTSRDIKPQEIEYLLLLERFRDLIKRQVECTAEEKFAEELRTKNMERFNAKLIANIEEYKSTLKSEMDFFQEATSTKRNTIAKLKEELEALESSGRTRLKQKILDSDRQMVVQSRLHAVRFEMLKEDEEQCRNNYETTLRTDLSEEKKQRARRFKVETQLLSWLQKYDLEMGEKQLELDELTDKYEEELKWTEALEEKLAEQDKEFLPLMAERDEEYHLEMTKKEMLFRMDHAARIIQVAWRTVLNNRAEKKKLRKKLKKMQEGAAAVEKKAKRKK